MNDLSLVTKAPRSCKSRSRREPLRNLATATVLALTGFTNCFAQSNDLAKLGDAEAIDFTELERAMLPGKIPENVVHPCDTFSSTQLTALFGDEAQEATVERNHLQKDVTCTYKWPNPQEESEEQKALFQEALMDAMLGGGDRSAKMKKLTSLASQTEFELSINFNYGGDFQNEQDAIDGLDKMVARLTKGVGDDTFSYSASFEPSEKIGSKAVWSEKLRQVTVVRDTYLFHVKLRRQADPAADREDAESVARIVAEAIETQPAETTSEDAQL